MIGSKGWYCALRMPAISVVYPVPCPLLQYIFTVPQWPYFRISRRALLTLARLVSTELPDLPDIRQKEKCDVVRCVPEIIRCRFGIVRNCLIECTQCVRDAALLLHLKFLRKSLLDCRKPVPRIWEGLPIAALDFGKSRHHAELIGAVESPWGAHRELVIYVDNC
jgi:hypothetical protein